MVWGATAPLPHRDVDGEGGYRYRQWSNGDVLILASPRGSEQVLLRASAGGAYWEAITKAIGPFPKGRAVASGIADIASELDTEEGDAVSGVIRAFQDKGRAAGWAAAAKAAVTVGPRIYDAARGWVDARGDNPVAIQQKLAKLRAKKKAAKRAGRREAAAKLEFRIHALEVRLHQLETAQQDEPAPPTIAGQAEAKETPWLALGGVGAAGLLLILLFTGRPR